MSRTGSGWSGVGRNFARRRGSQKRPEQCRRVLKYHLWVYVLVNAILVAANLTLTPAIIWAIWPLLGWGAGWLLHAFIVYMNNRGR